jgi:very-short-patch-repair endonuclease
MILKICKNCGNQFYVKPVYRDTAKYCSIKCKAEDSKILSECKNCGKTFWRRSRGKCSFCSRECSSEYKKKGKVIECEWCHKLSYKPKSLYDNVKTHFCSLECANNYQKKCKLKLICKTCKKEFYVSRSKEERIYCSVACRNLDKDWVQSTSLKANLTQLNKKGLNKLELKGRKILEELGLVRDRDFMEQYLLFNKFIVDVWIPEKRLVVQWDGTYWHSQPRRKRLDISQDRYMNKSGINVLRFSDLQIKDNISDVCENIKKAMQAEGKYFEIAKERIDAQPSQTTIDAYLNTDDLMTENRRLQ